MSNVEKIGTQIGQICVGLSALMLGDASGGTLAAQGLVGLAAIGAALHGQSSKRACAKAQSKAIAALKTAPEFNAVNLDRLSALLESETKAFTRADLIDASKNAANLDLDAELARRLHAALPFDGDDAATKRLLLLALEAGMRACNADAAFKAELASVQLLHITQELAEMKRTLDQVVTHVQTRSELSLEARELARQEKLIRKIAETYLTTTPDDPLQALEGIEAALERLSADVARDRAGSNFESGFDEMLTEVDRLILEEGQLDAANQRLQRAKDEIAEKHRELTAETIRVIDKEITIASLENDPARAAELEIERLAHGGEQAAMAPRIGDRAVVLLKEFQRTGRLFEGQTAFAMLEYAFEIATPEDAPDILLGNMANTAKALGEKDSSPDALLQAINLFHDHLRMVPRVLLPLDWATTQMNLGTALATLGERETSTDRLDQAVAAYRAALQEFTRDRVPLDWARTQMNLGNALRALGERDNRTDRLEQAVTAYRAALQEFPRDRVPLQWAMTKMNLANALTTLGERESNTDRLKQAVTAYRAALKERTHDRVPHDWAMTQMNLGNALRILGEHESGTDSLEQAISACRAALEEMTRDSVPLNWARIQMNLGTALATLGLRENGIARLEQAVTAYRAALQEYTRDRMPLDWAKVHGNLCSMEIAFFDIGADPAHLDAAQSYLDAAREAFAEAGASQYVLVAEQQQAEIDARRP